jgi:hypothetical protein
MSWLLNNLGGLSVGLAIGVVAGFFGSILFIQWALQFT